MKIKRFLALGLSGLIALSMISVPAAADDPSSSSSSTTPDPAPDPHANELAINETNFPDAVFRAKVKENFDRDSSDTLSETELNNVTNIAFPAESGASESSKIANLKGIEHFPNLSSLNCAGNSLTAIDLSKNPRMRMLICRDNKLTSLTVNAGVTSINCSGNRLTEIKVDQCYSLIYLNCSNNSLGGLDVARNTTLKDLNCSGNSGIGTLNLAKNTALEKLDCTGCGLSALSLSTNTKLTQLICKQNSITELDITGLKTIIAEYEKAEPSAEVLSYDEGVSVTYTTAPAAGTAAETEVAANSVTITIAGAEPPSENVVWANGKDVKDDKKTPNIDETLRCKTSVFSPVMRYSGGKWAVAVTTSDIDTVEKFVALFSKGKLTAAGKSEIAKAKKKAAAKIKDGDVTVTAGKETGTVRVWVYEIRKKEIVNDDDKGVWPISVEYTVLSSPSAPVIGEESDFTNGVLGSGKKPASVCTIPYRAGLTDEEQEAFILSYGDKKSAFSDAAQFTLTNSDKDAADVEAAGVGKFSVKPKAAKSITLTLKSVQSGKTAKIKVDIVKYYMVTLPDGVEASYKGKSGTVVVKNGDYVPDGTTLDISVTSAVASAYNVKVNGGAVLKSKHTVSGKEAVFTLEAKPAEESSGSTT